jgi:hypothetical protein
MQKCEEEHFFAAVLLSVRGFSNILSPSIACAFAFDWGVEMSSRRELASASASAASSASSSSSRAGNDAPFPSPRSGALSSVSRSELQVSRRHRFLLVFVQSKLYVMKCTLFVGAVGAEQDHAGPKRSRWHGCPL